MKLEETVIKHTKMEIGKAVVARIAEGYGKYTKRYKAFDFYGVVTMADSTRYQVICRWPDGMKVAEVDFKVTPHIDKKPVFKQALPCAVCGEKSAAAKVTRIMMKHWHRDGYLREFTVPLCRKHLKAPEVRYRRKVCVPLTANILTAVKKSDIVPIVWIGTEISPGLFYLGKPMYADFGMAVDVTTGEVYHGKLSQDMQKTGYCIEVPKMPTSTSVHNTWRKWAASCRAVIAQHTSAVKDEYTSLMAHHSSSGKGQACAICKIRALPARVQLVSMVYRSKSNLATPMEVPLCADHLNSPTATYKKRICTRLQ